MKIKGINFKNGDIFSIKYKNNTIYRYVIKQIKDEDIELSAILDTRERMYKNFKAAKLQNKDCHFFKNFDLKSEENYSFYVGKEFFEKGDVMKETYYEMTYTINNKKFRKIFCSCKENEKESYEYMNKYANMYSYTSHHIYKIPNDRLTFLRKCGISIKYIYEKDGI